MTAQIFEQVKLESISEKGSYGIGLQIGQQLADSQMDISVEAVAKGIFDALNRNQPALEINDLNIIISKINEFIEKHKQ